MTDLRQENSLATKGTHDALVLIDSPIEKLQSLNKLSEYPMLPIEMTKDEKFILLPPSSKFPEMSQTAQKENFLPNNHLIKSQPKLQNSSDPIFEGLKIPTMCDHLRNEFVPDHSADKDVPKEFSNYIVKTYISMYDLLRTEVVPQWVEYLSLKRQRTKLIAGKKRADTFKKKILRDLREFYRILFRKRFSSKEYKTKSDMIECVQKLYGEMGCFNVDKEELRDVELFQYLHQTHYKTVNKVLGKDKETNSYFLAVEKYNDKKFCNFLQHPLTAQMFYFVYSNFMDFYSPEIKQEYKSKVERMIKNILSFYNNCQEIGDINRITPDLFIS